MTPGQGLRHNIPDWPHECAGKHVCSYRVAEDGVYQCESPHQCGYRVPPMNEDNEE